MTKRRSIYNRKPLARTVALGLAAGATIVVACGPEFPAQLLDDRAGTLQGTPANSFRYEAQRLVTPADRLADAEQPPVYDGVQGRRIPEDDDRALTRPQREQLRRARALPDGDAAFAATEGLPLAVRLYAAGGVDYQRAQRPDGADPVAALHRARERFAEVLSLPAPAGRQRAAWAAYGLGLVAAALDERDAAVAAWHDLRERVRAGAPDPVGLAVASYGEEARLLLRTADGPCDYTAFLNGGDCADAIAPDALRAAIALYAEQAARGSPSGNDSLRMIAAWALADEASTRMLAADPVGQRLLVSYGLARLGDIVDNDLGSAYDNVVNYDTSVGSGVTDAARGERSVTPNPTLVVLIDALLGADPARIEGADRVAALAYRVGRYDQAAALAGRLDTALAWWVRAKLAIRQGDMDAAAQAYARAAQGFPQDPSVEAGNRDLIQGERGVLALSRGQFVDALDLLYTASSRPAPENVYPERPYWNDTAYVAERVLTTDELKRFVDARAPAQATPPLPADAEADGSFRSQPEPGALPASVSLRLLLARRLMRDGRYQEALPYFPENDDPRFVDTLSKDGKTYYKPSQLRERARAYLDARSRGQDAWRRTTRAAAWYEASKIARYDGMAIMGSELDPDFAVYGGFLSYGGGRYVYDKEGRIPPTAQGRAAQALRGPYITDEERTRYVRSEPRPYSRYHYREVAASDALRAADLVLPRTQAYAATLCQATYYIINDNGPRARSIYQRYIDNGAAVPFGATFGRECPEPDFDAASTFIYTQAWKRAQGVVTRHPWVPIAGLLLVLAAAAGAGWAWQRRTRRP